MDTADPFMTPAAAGLISTSSLIAGRLGSAWQDSPFYTYIQQLTSYQSTYRLLYGFDNQYHRNLLNEIFAVRLPGIHLTRDAGNSKRGKPLLRQVLLYRPKPTPTRTIGLTLPAQHHQNPILVAMQNTLERHISGDSLACFAATDTLASFGFFPKRLHIGWQVPAVQQSKNWHVLALERFMAALIDTERHLEAVHHWHINATQIVKRRSGSAVPSIIALIAALPVVTQKIVCKALPCTPRTFNSACAELAARKLITELSGRKSHRVWASNIKDRSLFLSHEVQPKQTRPRKLPKHAPLKRFTQDDYARMDKDLAQAFAEFDAYMTKPDRL